MAEIAAQQFSIIPGESESTPASVRSLLKTGRLFLAKSPIDLTNTIGETVMQSPSSGKTARYAALILIGLATTGCQKMGSASQTQPGIPTAVGELVSVTPGDGAHQAVLWFKQSDQTIVAVRVTVASGTNRYPRN